MDDQIHKVINLCTKNYVHTTVHLTAIADSLRNLVKIAYDINSTTIRKSMVYDCRKIKRNLNDVCAKAKTKQKEYAYEAYRVRENTDVALKTLINTKRDYLQLKRSINDILLTIEHCTEGIIRYQKPYKTAKLMLYTYDDEVKKRQCQQYIESELHDQEILKQIRRICLLTKKRLEDVDKRYSKIIIKIDVLLEGEF